MKKLALLAALVPAVALAQGITNTRHDMSFASTTAGPKTTSAGQTQTCIYCHTPHKSLQQALIWNHNLAVGTRGWTAGSLTTSNTALPAAISASSMRCLACHDGTVGLGNVNNVGNGTPGTIVMSGPVTAGYLIGNGAVGNEMLNNHPVSVPYAGATYQTIVSGAVTTGTFDYQATSNTGCDTPSGWCTAAATNGIRIYLYGTAANNVGIECGSCHEVHNKYGGQYFLRAPAAGSALCLACHEK